MFSRVSKRLVSGLAVLCFALDAYCVSPSQGRLRIAVIGFTSDEEGAGEQVLVQSAALDSRFTVIDRSWVRASVKGLGYDGSLNLSLEEAKRLGAAVGCDVFIAGKIDKALRSRRSNESHLEATVALIVVDGRNGTLITWDLINAEGSTQAGAFQSAISTLAARASNYFDHTVNAFAERVRGHGNESVQITGVEEIPEPTSARAAGFSPPVFLSRSKPDYTEQADQAAISATVEAQVVFRSDGQIGEIELKRWAAFGLDESAIRAIRQIKFKPATRDGRPVDVRGLVRYSFRRSEG